MGGGVKALFDRQFEKLKNYRGIEINDPAEIQTVNKEDSILIIALERSTAVPLIHYFMGQGWRWGQNLFLMEDFLEWHLKPYLFFHENKIYMENLTICVSKNCTLKCRECSQRMPHQKIKEMYNLDVLTADIDRLFTKIDFINSLAITGGEPLLFRDLDRYLEYMMRHYGNQIGSVRVVSNGTLIPNDKLLDTAHRYHILFEITKYSNDMVKTDQLRKICCKKDVPFVENIHEHWFKMWREQKRESGNNNLFEQCICHSHCDGYIDGRLTKCLCAYMAGMSFGELDTADYLEFRKDIPKEIVFEYLWGYTEKGHLSACEMCNGLYGINTDYVTPGEQI